MPGYEDQSYAAAGVDEPCDGGDGSDCDYPLIGRSNHAAHRSIPGWPFLRYPSWRIGSSLDALLLDLWTSGSLRSDHSMFRFHVGNHSGIFAQTDLRISGNG